MGVVSDRQGLRPPDDSFVRALSRREWEQDREEFGPNGPDETYEDYLEALRRKFMSVRVRP